MLNRPSEIWVRAQTDMSSDCLCITGLAIHAKLCNRALSSQMHLICQTNSRQTDRQTMPAKHKSPPAAAEDAPANPTGDRDPDSAESARQKHAADISQRRTLFVRSLPYTVTSEQLSERFSFVAPIKHATVVVDPVSKQSRGFGFITFSDAHDAQRALSELNGTALFDGRRVKIEMAVPRHRSGTASADTATTTTTTITTAITAKGKGEAVKKRSPRLIIRNLPWSVTRPEQLVRHFQSFGKVKDVIIPRKPSGEMSGFAFVTMKGYKNAQRAMDKINATTIDGRVVAVDWAVEKSTWTAQQQQQQQAQDKGGKAAEGGEAGEADEDVEIEVEDHSVDGEDEDMDDEDDEFEDEDGEDGVKDEDGGGGGEDEDDDEDDEDEDEDDGEDDEDDGEDEDNDKDTPATDSTTTLFVRNLPYSATDDSLFAHFSRFGAVRYARTVTDPATARPRGTGFVCFYDPDTASAVLRGAPRDSGAPPRSAAKPTKTARPSLLTREALDPDGAYTLDGRLLAVSRAVDRREAERLAADAAQARTKMATDRRRLYLVAEGTIAPSSPLWKQLPPSERLLRDRSREQRRRLLQADPNLHLSLTRLSVRNLPRWVTARDLKQLARKAIPGYAAELKAGLREPLSREELDRDGGEGRAAEAARRTRGVGVVKQAKVQLEGAGGGRSRGYGFVEYWSHRYALMGLRHMNGLVVPGSAPALADDGAQPREPGAATAAAAAAAGQVEKKKRMIVEFAIENAKVVSRRRENEARSREIALKRRLELQSGSTKPAKPAGPVNLDRKLSAKDFKKNKAAGSQGGVKRKRGDGGGGGGGDGGAKKQRKNWNQKTAPTGGDTRSTVGDAATTAATTRTQAIIRQKRMARRAKRAGGK